MRNYIKFALLLTYASTIGVFGIVWLSQKYDFPALPFIYVLVIALIDLPLFRTVCCNCGAKLVQKQNLVKSKLGFYYLPLSVTDRCPACGHKPFK